MSPLTWKDLAAVSAAFAFVRISSADRASTPLLVGVDVVGGTGLRAAAHQERCGGDEWN